MTISIIFGTAPCKNLSPFCHLCKREKRLSSDSFGNQIHNYIISARINVTFFITIQYCRLRGPSRPFCRLRFETCDGPYATFLEENTHLNTTQFLETFDIFQPFLQQKILFYDHCSYCFNVSNVSPLLNKLTVKKYDFYVLLVFTRLFNVSLARLRQVYKIFTFCNYNLNGMVNLFYLIRLLSGIL